MLANARGADPPPLEFETDLGFPNVGQIHPSLEFGADLGFPNVRGPDPYPPLDFEIDRSSLTLAGQIPPLPWDLGQVRSLPSPSQRSWARFLPDTRGQDTARLFLAGQNPIPCPSLATAATAV